MTHKSSLYFFKRVWGLFLGVTRSLTPKMRSFKMTLNFPGYFHIAFSGHSNLFWIRIKIEKIGCEFSKKSRLFFENFRLPIMERPENLYQSIFLKNLLRNHYPFESSYVFTQWFPFSAITWAYLLTIHLLPGWSLWIKKTVDQKVSGDGIVFDSNLIQSEE